MLGVMENRNARIIVNCNFYPGIGTLLTGLGKGITRAKVFMLVDRFFSAIFTK